MTVFRGLVLVTVALCIAFVFSMRSCVNDTKAAIERELTLRNAQNTAKHFEQTIAVACGKEKADGYVDCEISRSGLLPVVIKCNAEGCRTGKGI